MQYLQIQNAANENECIPDNWWGEREREREREEDGAM